MRHSMQNFWTQINVPGTHPQQQCPLFPPNAATAQNAPEDGQKAGGKQRVRPNGVVGRREEGHVVVLPEHGPYRDADYHQAGHEEDDIEDMEHVFNEIDAAAVRVTSFVSFLGGASVAVLGRVAGRRNYQRGRSPGFLLFGHNFTLLSAGHFTQDTFFLGR